MNIALVLSSGIGARFGGNIPKQYIKLNGKEVISYVIAAAFSSQKVDKVVVVANGSYCDEIKQTYNVETLEGGATRNVSLRNGVDYIKNKYPECKCVVVLDAVRPFVTGLIIDDYISKIEEGNQICVTTKKITDSLCCIDCRICDRDRYFMTSSPMSFEFSSLEKYLDKDSKLVEVLQMYPENTKIYYNYSFKENYKITYQEDVDLLETLLKLKELK